MPSHRKTFRVSAAGAAIEKVKSVSPNVEVVIVDTVAASQTDHPISVFVESATLVSFHIWADQACTVETNNGTTPQETLTLDGIDAVSWVTGEGTAPIAGDVTALYVTTGTAATTTIKLIAGWT